VAVASQAPDLHVGLAIAVKKLFDAHFWHDPEAQQYCCG
jgi:hypothetical protein